MSKNAITRALVKKLAAEVDEKELTLRSEIVHKNLATRKVMTSVPKGALLRYLDKLPYGKDQDGDPKTIICKYQDHFSGKFYSISVKDILNKLVLPDGNNLSSQVGTADVWLIPALLYISDVELEEESKRTYPITMYTGYSRSLFEKEGLELSKALDAVKLTPKHSYAEPFHKTVKVITDPTKVPLNG
jgi:hypothetical protein